MLKMGVAIIESNGTNSVCNSFDSSCTYFKMDIISNNNTSSMNCISIIIVTLVVAEIVISTARDTNMYSVFNPCFA